MQVWSLARKSLLRTFEGRLLKCLAMSLLPNGGLAAAGTLVDEERPPSDMSQIIAIYDVSSGRLLQTLEGPKDIVAGLCFTEGHLISSSVDTYLRVWQADAAGKVGASLVKNAATSPSMGFNLTFCFDFRPCPLTQCVPVGKLKTRYYPSRGGLVPIAPSTIAMACVQPGDVAIYDWKKLTCLNVLSGFGREVAIAALPGTGRIAAASRDRRLRIGPTDAWASAATLHSRFELDAVVPLCDGTFLTRDYSGSITRWNLQGEIETYRGEGGFLRPQAVQVIGHRMTLLGTSNIQVFE